MKYSQSNKYTQSSRWKTCEFWDLRLSQNIHQGLKPLLTRKVINKICILDGNSCASHWLYLSLLDTFMWKRFLFNHLLAILFPVCRNANLYSLCMMLHNPLWYSYMLRCALVELIYLKLVYTVSEVFLKQIRIYCYIFWDIVIRLLNCQNIIKLRTSHEVNISCYVYEANILTEAKPLWILL